MSRFDRPDRPDTAVVIDVGEFQAATSRHRRAHGEVRLSRVVVLLLVALVVTSVGTVLW
jgi:hypothetical protein